MMKKTISFIGVTVLLILTTAFCVTGTVQSRSSHKVQMEESFYRELEDAYEEEIRTYLVEKGYVNCGIMLTRTVYEDGSREYQLVVHNSRFAKLSQEETSQLVQEMEERAFTVDDCSFNCLVKGNA